MLNHFNNCIINFLHNYTKEIKINRADEMVLIKRLLMEQLAGQRIRTLQYLTELLQTIQTTLRLIPKTE